MTDPLDQAGKRVGILLLPRFPLLAFSALITPLQEANRLASRPIYDLSILSSDAAPAVAEGGVAIAPTASIRDSSPFDLAVVCAGYAPKNFADRRVLTWVRSNARKGARLGAVSTGTHVLALAGVLGQRRCTIHWENAPSLAEEFPDISLTKSIFEIDGQILSCGGGTSAMDMILNVIGRDFGSDFAIAVSHQFQHDRIRTHADLQDSTAFFVQKTKSSKVAMAEQYIQLKGRAALTPGDVARHIAVSQRQLDRLFRNHLGKTPIQYLIENRVRQARELLLSTRLPVMEVALAAGFGSRSSFYRSYKRIFGKTPIEERDRNTRFGVVPG